VSHDDPATEAHDRPVRAVVVGECLIELVRTGADTVTTRPAGDTFNTASMLARASRALGSPAEVSYRTGLGDDPLSGTIATALRDHGLVDASVRLPGRACGLYLLDGSTGDMWYWRGDSAARELFHGEDWLPNGAAPDLVFLSLITLQQMSEHARDLAADWVAGIHSGGGTVAFSANHRAAGWPSSAAAADEAARFAARADLVFASATDCAALFGTTGVEAALESIGRLGAGEAIVTAGEDGASVSAGGERLHVPAVTPAGDVRGAVDATGAGDAFAGAYLAWRSAGRPPEEAARAAVRVASQTVTFVGALPQAGSAEWSAMDGLLSELGRGPRA
jgi:2-dehydro-3-deoxygluconokinase